MRQKTQGTNTLNINITKQRVIMEKYIGIKQIEAKQMNLGEYNEYKGWTIPEDEDPLRDGYLVKYSNDYETWSPIEAFQEAYFLLDDGRVAKDSIYHLVDYANTMMVAVQASRIKSIVNTKMEEILLFVKYKL